MANQHKIGDLVMARKSELGEPEKFVFGMIWDTDYHKYRVHWMDGNGGHLEWHANGQIETWKALLNEKLRD